MAITSSIYRSIWIPLRLVLLMIMFFLVEEYLGLDLRMFANLPRTLEGLLGILFAPLVHINLYHLLSNLFPILCLGTIIYWFYPTIANKVFLRAYLLPMVLVWLFARPTYHVGASGLVYGLAFFLIFFGFFRKDFKSLLISIIILSFFGGLFYGVLPGQPQISFESHLAGALAGGIAAFEFSKFNPSRKTPS